MINKLYALLLAFAFCLTYALDLTVYATKHQIGFAIFSGLLCILFVLTLWYEAF
jgi:hypothetical protein